jgi:hypothetical protein
VLWWTPRHWLLERFEKEWARSLAKGLRIQEWGHVGMNGSFFPWPGSSLESKANFLPSRATLSTSKLKEAGTG